VPGLRAIAVALVLLIGTGGVGVFAIAASGLYSVAASSGHWAIFEWFLAFGMKRSVATHAIGIDAPPLDDPNMIRLGAGHYQNACVMCHGAPGENPSAFLQKALPDPPNLVDAVKDWTPEQMFWIVKHGIKYTGMPGWTALQREDEIWSVVSFLEELPKLSPAQYEGLANGNVQEDEQSPGDLAEHGAGRTDAICAGCHGNGRQPPASRLVPKLAGLSQDYLTRSLKEYSEGKRPSGIMQPVASQLDDEEIAKLAAYYAAMPRPPEPAGAAKAPAEQIERGRLIATNGVPVNAVPACLPCHSGNALPAYPRLEGQNAPYMAGQLKLWRAGQRKDTQLGAIMVPIASRMTDQEIADVAAYFDSLAAPGTTASQAR
jgi:cytochrome c553